MKAYEQLNDRHVEFIGQQHMFFVATAPLSADGHVNLSPKGYDSFVVLDPKRVAYLDFGGSGIETHAHVNENGRICIMFCSFGEIPLILRLYGRARAFAADSERFAELRPRFAGVSSPVRGVIDIELDRVQDSCGWGVPYYRFEGERERLRAYHDKGTQAQVLEKVYSSNTRSIDGLPGLVRDSQAGD